MGILGGTFDPVHNAHLAIARTATQALGLDKILWIPTGKPDYREPAVANVEHRLAMLALALKGEPGYEIDRRELAASASPYTVDTLKALHAERPQDEFYLLLGADQYASLRRWREPAEVARLARVAVFTRPGYEAPPGGDAIVVPMAPLAVSGSEIRARAARRESLSGLLPPPVANYISENRLYR
ncbi:MAG TPA: nicotinate-nucleotide adenylyltransferase [Burkholderiales bacterium]|nr:nicotinate-nucleotide adenylyltransferase [Burkholderiales bacterium]